MTYPGLSDMTIPPPNWIPGAQPWQGSPVPPSSLQFWPSTWSPSHFCVWQVISAQRHGEETAALLRCELCSFVRSECLFGSWTLAQLRGEDIEESPAGHVPAAEEAKDPSNPDRPAASRA